MPTLSKSNIQNGQIVEALHVSQLVDAFTYSGSYDILISSSVSIGSGSINPSYKLNVIGDTNIDGDVIVSNSVNAPSFTGSFQGSGSGIIGIVSASHASNSNQSLSATSSSYALSASYAENAATASNALTASFALNASAGSSGNITGSGNIGFITKFSGLSGSVYILTGSSFISESATTVSVSAPTIFSNTAQVTGLFSANGGVSSTTGQFSSFVSASAFAQYGTGSVIIQNGSGSFSGTVTAPGFFQSSLRVLKTNISPFTEPALDIIKNVDVVFFSYKRTPHIKRIGFIADDTHEYLSGEEHNVMDVNNSIGILLKGIQELIKENFDLKARITKLEKGV